MRINRPFAYLSLLLFLVARSGFAQSILDDYGGRLDKPCPVPLHRVAASCNRLTNQAVCTITNATIVQDPTYSNDYDVTISNPAMTFVIGIDEPFQFFSFGNGIDWTFDGTDQQTGFAILNAVNLVSGQLTFTTHTSGTAVQASGKIQPARSYTPFSQGTQLLIPVQVAQFTITTEEGTTYPTCDPEGNWKYVQSISAMRDGVSSTTTSSRTITSSTSNNGVVTALASFTVPTWIVGSSVTSENIDDSTYNGTFLLTGVANSVQNPAPPILSTSGAAGAKTISYKVVGVTGSGMTATTAASTVATITTANATLDGTNFVIVTTIALTGATSCNVYRTATNGTSPTTTGLIGNVSCGSALNDTGLAGDSTIPPSTNSTGEIQWADTTTNPTAVGGDIKFGANRYGLITLSQTAGTVTAIYNQLATVTIGLGAAITTAGGTNATFDGPSHITSIQGSLFTYPLVGASGIGTGGTVFWDLRTKYGGDQCLGARSEVATAKSLGFNDIGEDSTGTVQNNQTGGTSCPANGFSLDGLSPGNGSIIPVSLYSFVNLGGNVDQPMKDLMAGIDHQFADGWSTLFVDELDWPDSRYFNFTMNRFAAGLLFEYQAPSTGLLIDDTDNTHVTTDSGGIFFGCKNATVASGCTRAGMVENDGMMVAESDPHQVIMNRGVYSASSAPQPPFIYPDDQLKAKTLSVSVPAGCFATPSFTSAFGGAVGPTFSVCGSWLDWDRNWYGNNIANLNTAYGSKFTSFGTSGTAVAGVVIGTGDGVTTTFTCTLGSGATCGTGTPGNIVPDSIHLNYTPSGGAKVMISGDCPNFGNGSGKGTNACPGTVGGGEFLRPAVFNVNTTAGLQIASGFLLTDSNNCIEQAQNKGQTAKTAPTWSTPCGSATPTVSSTVTFTNLGPAPVNASSTINYSTGALTVVFATAPPLGASIAIDYSINGFDTTLGTGLGDTDGTGIGGGWGVGTVNTTGTTVNWISGDQFVTSGAWNGIPIKINNSIFHISSVVSATSLTTTSSVGTLTGASFQITGFGQNEVCLLNPPVWAPSTSYTAYGRTGLENDYGIVQSQDGTSWQLVIKTHTSGLVQPTFSVTTATISSDGNFVSIGSPICPNNNAFNFVIDTNQNLAHDLINYLGFGLVAAKYSSDWKAAHLMIPDIIDIGTNFSLQTYDIPTYPQEQATESWFSEGAFTGQFPEPTTLDSMSTYKYPYATTRYNKQIMSEMFTTVANNWDMMCNTGAISGTFFCANGVRDRSTQMYNAIKNFLTVQSSDGIFRHMGWTWWGNLPFQEASFDYETQSGNLADGVQDVTSVITCPPPNITLQCGGEVSGLPWVGLDAVNGPTGMKALLSEWNPAGTAKPTALSKRGIFANITLLPKAGDSVDLPVRLHEPLFF